MHFGSYDHLITVDQVHLDELKHVNNVVYLQWVQDAAAAHWSTRANDEIKHKYHWVVLRHEIDYKTPGLLADELIARTWVYDYQGVKSTRIVQIIRIKDKKLLAAARSTWCLISSVTGRPTRIADDIRSIFIPELPE